MRNNNKNKCIDSSICNKAFTQLANLQRHNLVHNGECVTILLIDFYLFFVFVVVVARLLISNLLLGLKPYKCPTCQKAFSQHANMVKHQMLHTGEKVRNFLITKKKIVFCCCSHDLNSSFFLIFEMQPFKCKSCDKAFAQRANLKKHEMIHLVSLMPV